MLHIALTDRNLDERYQVIAKEFVAPFREWRALNEKRNEGNKTTFTIPFDILSKIFWPKEKIRDFFKTIQVDSLGHRYYQDPRRNHKTDGIIITPNVPYLLKRAPTLFKWKYSDLQTIGMAFPFNCITYSQISPVNYPKCLITFTSIVGFRTMKNS
jgi:hypothetical protein